MALYQFRDEKTGEDVELDFPMDKAPEIGSIIRRGGRKLKRLVSRMSQPKVMGDVFRNFQVDPNSPAGRDCDGKDDRGHPYWTSRKRANEWARRWDGDGISAELDD